MKNHEDLKNQNQNEEIHDNKKNKSLTLRTQKFNYNKKSKIKGPYYLGITLGEGTFGKVKMAIHIKTGEKIAIKIINKEKLANIESNIQNVKKEISILKKILHKNIIQIYEVMESKHNLYIAMEYCENKELFDYIVSKGKLSEKESCKIFQQIINGVQYLHQQGICHRDLKPENILLDAKNNVKISDFGLSTFLPKNKMLSTPCGTPTYAPPEMLKGEKYNGELSDVWSCGIILFALLNGNVPFEESQEILVYKKIIQSQKLGLKFCQEISRDAKDLIIQMLKFDPKERICINDIIKHKWFNIIENSMRPGIDFNSNQSIPIDENILLEVGKYGYDIEECRKHLNMNKYDSITSVYRLLMKRFVLEGGTSIGDLNSKQYLNYIQHSKAITDNNEKTENISNNHNLDKKFLSLNLVKNKKKIYKNNNVNHNKKRSMDINSANLKLDSIINDNSNYCNNNINTPFSENKNISKETDKIKDKNYIPKNITTSYYMNNKKKYHKIEPINLEHEFMKKPKKINLVEKKRQNGILTNDIFSNLNKNYKKQSINKKNKTKQLNYVQKTNSLSDTVLQLENEDLKFEEELNKLNSITTNVNMIKIMAQKLMSNSFYSSFDIYQNKSSNQDREKTYNNKKIEEKNSINSNSDIKNKKFNITNLNQFEKNQEYNDELVKKKEINLIKKTKNNRKKLFQKNQNLKSNKKRNTFIDISTTQFDSSIERSSSFNKSNILTNSSKKKNPSTISIPFFSLNLNTINNILNHGNNIIFEENFDKKKKININNTVLLSNKQQKRKINIAINKIDTIPNNHLIKKSFDFHKINNQNNKSQKSNNNKINNKKSIIGLFKSKIPLIKNNKYKTINPSPIILNKNLNIYLKYKNEKENLTSRGKKLKNTLNNFSNINKNIEIKLALNLLYHSNNFENKIKNVNEGLKNFKQFKTMRNQKTGSFSQFLIQNNSDYK